MKFKSPLAITGIVVFIASFVVYFMSLEPTTSFWDCSEFILSANKLEVNHPSGAPLFVLLARLFTFLSFGNKQEIARSVNLMSGLFSALTIFFMYHSLVFLAKKITGNQLLVIGSAVLGSLTFAFTDSFWFSAVEGEVYALSMFFLIICFWAVLKWEANFGELGNDRWILFIAILTGLGLGVHLLNLLIIPSVAMIIFLKVYSVSFKNILFSFIIGTILLLSVLYVLIPGMMWFLSICETLFINSFHLPLNSGIILGILLLGGLLAYGIHYFQKKEKPRLALVVFSTALILTGFSVYAVSLIRSQAQPPVNFGEPDNIYSLIDYLNREQYPKRPLLYGQNYNTPIISINERETKDFDGSRYVERDLPATYEYDTNTCTFFPRMYSNDSGHVEAYGHWINISGKRVKVKDRSRKNEVLTIPTLADNVAFFFKFQSVHMFWRYFMWNFTGRQNDIQGRGELTKGNWISGINLIDALRLGPQDNLPDWLRNNRARNTYFFLPLLLGIIGAVFHFKKDRVSFFSVLSLFLLAGLGLVVYINEIPIVPRERDYVYVGAFMAFSIWIGFSFIAMAEFLSQKIPSKLIPVLLFVVLFLASPVLLLAQNFNDHSRANRYAARDFASNILNSCPPNAILFTSGDNDTYPILYCQEVEEIRPDVRVVVMPFVSANWFLDQLKMKKNRSDGLKMQLPQKEIDEGALDYVAVLNKIDKRVDMEEALKFVASNEPGTKLKMRDGDTIHFIPAEELYLNVSADGKTGQIPVSLAGRDMLYKHELAFWDIIASNVATRPICFASKLEAQNHGLLNYLKLDGLIYQLVPERNNIKRVQDNPPADTDKLYAQLMNEFKWGNLDNPDVNIDYFTVFNASVFQLRNIFNTLAENLLKEGKQDKAQAVLKKSISLFRAPVFQYDNLSLYQAELLFNAGLNDLGIQLVKDFVQSAQEDLAYYSQFEMYRQKSLKLDIMSELYYYQELVRIIEGRKLENEIPDARSGFENFAALFHDSMN